MLKNYLTIALRTLRRHKSYAFINVVGLAVGLACCILIFWFVRTELRTDAFHEKADRLYRVTYEEISTPSMRHLATISPPMGPALADEYPEIEQFVRLRDSDRHLLAHGEQRFYEEQFFYADSTFFDLFTFPLEKGDPDVALDAPGSIVLTHETAEKYFGSEDPMGKTLTFDDERRFTVTGVLAPLPGRSHLQFDFLLSFSTFRVPRGYPVTLESWHWISFYTYVLLHEDADPEAVEAKLPGFMARHFNEERAQNVRLRLQPVTDIYLGEPKDTFIASGNPAYVYGLSGIAVLILLLACFNFMNLSTAYSIRRSKEAGVRKALGAHRGSLIKQFLGEAILTALISLLLALILVQGGRALLSGWIGWEAAVSASDFGLTLALFAGLAVLLGAAAGAYPAFVVSRFQPSRVLRGDAPGGLSNAGLRRGLVVLQFTIAIALITGTLVATQQMRYVQQKELGFDREQILALHLRGEDLLMRYPVLKERLQQNPRVVSVTMAGSLFDGYHGSVPVFPEGAPEGEDVRAMNLFGVHYDFFETLGIDIAKGRAHAEAFPADSASGLMLNETAARYFATTTPGWDDPIGKRLRVGDIIEGRVIGVAEDFHFASLHAEINPLVLYIPPTVMEHVLLRVRPGDAAALLASLKADWQAVAPDVPFEYSFLDDRVQRLYEEDRRFFRLIVAASLLAILVACLGLYGLVAFATQLRTKEIGIRKVLGASVPNLVALLARPFLLYVLAANLLAWPLAYLAMHRWLEGFAYRIDVSAAPFLIAGLLTLVVAFLTMSSQSIKAALADPVESLRYE